MRIRTRISEEAHARGLTAAEVARRVGWYRSNLSAMDAGTRAVSLRSLARAARVLGCSVGELLEVQDEPNHPVFREAALNRRLTLRDAETSDGSEKGWVHRVQLAWRRHSHAKSVG